MWTMIDAFKELSPEDFDALVEAPALITILVGGSDGLLDQEEIHWSERLLRSRTYNKPNALNEFYRVVSEKFWVRVTVFLQELPKDVEERNAQISKQLEKLNPILAQMDQQLAADLYKGFVGLAEETAKSSGGFLRIGAIGEAEARWIHLPMLTPIISPNKDPEPEETEED